MNGQTSSFADWLFQVLNIVNAIIVDDLIDKLLPSIEIKISVCQVRTA
jgi:hypothetical protein